MLTVDPNRSPFKKHLLEILDLISKVIQLDVMHLAPSTAILKKMLIAE